MPQYFELIGLGHAFPAQTLTADDIDRRTGREPGWTRTHAGVETRYMVDDRDTLGVIGRRAIESALADADLALREIDLLIDASTSRPQPIPSNGPAVLREFGEEARGMSCVDVHHTCLSFVMAMHVANGLLGVGAYERVLIVSSESPLTAANWCHAESTSVLGDGAAAGILQRRATPEHPYVFRHECYPEHYDACGVRGGGHTLPAFRYDEANDDDFRFSMDGRSLMRIAKARLPDFYRQLLAEAGDPTDFHLIPHPASPMALVGVRRWLDVAEDRFHGDGIVEHGNVAAAGIPITLDRLKRAGVIGCNDTIMLLGTSAGYSQAGLVFTL